MLAETIQRYHKVILFYLLDFWITLHRLTHVCSHGEHGEHGKHGEHRHMFTAALKIGKKKTNQKKKKKQEKVEGNDMATSIITSQWLTKFTL